MSYCPCDKLFKFKQKGSAAKQIDVHKFAIHNLNLLVTLTICTSPSLVHNQMTPLNARKGLKPKDHRRPQLHGFQLRSSRIKYCERDDLTLPYSVLAILSS